MGTDRVEFASGELRIVGGDYGRIELEGTTEEARRALDQVVAADRRSGNRNVVSYFIVEFHDSPDLFEDRHAGREGTPESGVGGIERAAGRDDKATAASGVANRRASRAKR